ncbi:MAG TPA: flotillin family protein, partial [Bacteroidales bacterium]|nr:flotillin family protein [Bacteroidales bacterium]
SPATANFLSGMFGSIPPLQDLFKMAGMELPEYLKGKTQSEQYSEYKPAEEVSEEKGKKK